MKCAQCKYVDIVEFSLAGNKWGCGKKPGIVFGAYPADKYCSLDSGPPDQGIPIDDDEYLQPILALVIQLYMEVWPKFCKTISARNSYFGNLELAETVSRLERILIRNFGFNKYDIKQLQKLSSAQANCGK